MGIPLPDQPSGGRSQFPPIGDYGFLSDCEATALVAPDGGIEWLCLPRMDSPSVFGAILDRDAGSFRINPAGVEVPAARRYIPGTMVLETSWWTPGGWLVVTEPLEEAAARSPGPPTTGSTGWTAAGFPDHPWRSFLQRSALTLKGLTFAPTGAVVAAATTSLPETPGGVRNWDYRYTWIRDTAATLWALYALGFDWEANDFFHFVADVAEAESGHLQIMYGVDGERALQESTLDHLSGYDDARPVRIGNAAYTQRQHDVWGGVVGAIDLYTRYTRAHERVDDRLWAIVQTQVQRALEHWREPDQGIWEVRSEPQHFTFSKVACWVAADAGARLAEGRGEKKLAAQWRTAAEEIRADVLARAVDERGVFTQRYGGKALDASVLLIPLFRFLPPDDERVRNTVLAIADELTEDEMVLRYRVDETEDGLTGEEGTFTICSFWLVSALVQIGELARARALCEKLLSYASPLQLYAEEIDPPTGRQLGNFPQAFTHLALITAVTAVIRAERARPR